MYGIISLWVFGDKNVSIYPTGHPAISKNFQSNDVLFFSLIYILFQDEIKCFNGLIGSYYLLGPHINTNISRGVNAEHIVTANAILRQSVYSLREN